MESDFKRFNNQRIGLLTNITGVNQSLVPAIDLFDKHPGIHLTALFSPEHGIRGDIKEGEEVSSYTDPYTQLPIYSLYGENRVPSEAMMDEVDVIVFDLQDIGSRYYTFIYSMANVMEACEKWNKQLVVLDRPNPISGAKTEGNIVEKELRSFVGMLPIANRHGMTVAELAKMFKHEFGYACDLTVIPMQGWKRDMYFDDTPLFWVPPTPNVTHTDMMTLYTGTCLLEGTNLSEGRGTTKPFEVVGAPFIDGNQLAEEFNNQHLPGVKARPMSFIPNTQKFENEICGGIQLHVVNKEAIQSLKTGVKLLETVARLYPDKVQFHKDEQDQYFFDLLAGTKTLRNQIMTSTTDNFLAACESQIATFNEVRAPYLLYS
nr:DUF1343 domain-containing protein [Thalassobacillus sp. CUG 92003]